MISLAYVAAPTVCLIVTFCEAQTGHHHALTSRRTGRPSAWATARAEASNSLNSAALTGLTASNASENAAVRDSCKSRNRCIANPPKVVRARLRARTRARLCVSSSTEDWGLPTPLIYEDCYVTPRSGEFRSTAFPSSADAGLPV